MSALAAFLTQLDAAKAAADVAEIAFRAEAAARTQELATERAHAYRRADLMASLARTVEDAESPDLAAAAGQALLRARLGWDTDSAARTDVLEHFSAVALALHGAAADEAAPAEAADPHAALADFEAWYLSTRESPFWYLFDHYLPETPVVDF